VKHSHRWIYIKCNHQSLTVGSGGGMEQNMINQMVEECVTWEGYNGNSKTKMQKRVLE